MDFDRICDEIELLISAAIDDEITLAERERLEDHLECCEACRAVHEEWSAITRRVRLRPPAEIPDFATRVLDRARPARLGRGGWLRPALAWVAVVIAVQSIPPLVFGTVDGATTHVARHLGAFGLALAVGLAYAAWRPHRAFGLLPFAVALVLTTLISAALDVATGSSTALAESLHLTELAGLILLWMIAGSPGSDQVRALVPGGTRSRHHVSSAAIRGVSGSRP